MYTNLEGIGWGERVGPHGPAGGCVHAVVTPDYGVTHCVGFNLKINPLFGEHINTHYIQSSQRITGKVLMLFCKKRSFHDWFFTKNIN